VGGVPACPIGEVKHPLGITEDPEKFSATLVRFKSNKKRGIRGNKITTFNLRVLVFDF
jgi:hypothetical protein